VENCRRVSGTPDERTTYSYDENDRLLEETLDLLVGSDRQTSYDWGGPNRIATELRGKTVREGGVLKQQTTYSYNIQGRMSQAVTQNYVAGAVAQQISSTFRYGDNGIRVDATHQIQSDTDGTPSTLETTASMKTTYLNDPHNATGFSQVLVESTVNLVERC
jgi:hypothetical protein